MERIKNIFGSLQLIVDGSRSRSAAEYCCAEGGSVAIDSGLSDMWQVTRDTWQVTPDILKVDFFALSKFYFWQFCAIKWATKTLNMGKNLQIATKKKKNMYFQVCTSKSQKFAQSQLNFAPPYDSETVTFRNSVWHLNIFKNKRRKKQTKKVLMLLSAHLERFSVSCMQKTLLS